MFSEDCPFKVVRTNGGDEVLARAANLLIGRAAFETARRMYPKDLIEYRRGAQVIERSEPQQVFAFASIILNRKLHRPGSRSASNTAQRHWCHCNEYPQSRSD